MPNSRSRVHGARVLADLNALRGIGAYKTGVPHSQIAFVALSLPMRTIKWLPVDLFEPLRYSYPTPRDM
jgi:hypothetical protein